MVKTGLTLQIIYPDEPKLVIKHQIHSLDNDLYIGTSLGVYHTNDTMSEWEVYDQIIYPMFLLRDIEFNIEDQKIIWLQLMAGAYGNRLSKSKKQMLISA